MKNPLGKAMELALEKIEEQKVNYKANQIPIIDLGFFDY